MTLKFITIFIMTFSALCLTISVILYAINRKKYYALLTLFQQKHIFPAPYSFHCLTGFFGAVPMVYFFINLKEKKKIFFMKKNSEAYSFFNKDNAYLIKWMPIFYYTSMCSMSGYSFLAILAAALEVRSRYSL